MAKKVQKSKKKPDDVKAAKRKKLMVAVLVISALALGVGVIASMAFGGKSGDSDDDNGFTSMIPIYIAIFVPAIASGSSTDRLKDKNAKLLIVLGITIALVALGFLAWIVFARR